MRKASPGERVDRVMAALAPSTRAGRVISSPVVGAALDPSTYPIATPWGSSDLARLVADDVFGGTAPHNTRERAMRIPAIARARNVVCTTVARFPLAVLRGATKLEGIEAPTWSYESSQVQTWAHRLAWTVDDLMFYGWSCWSRANQADGTPARFTRIDRGRWTIDDDMQVRVDEMPVDPRDVVVIPGLHEGLLSYGVDAIKDITFLYSIVRQRLLNPVPGIELHQTGGTPLNRDEIDALIDGFAAARQGQNGGVSYTNQWIESKELGMGGDAQLLIEARNAAAVDCARLVGVHAGMLDATAPKASLNYETTTGRNQEFVDLDLALYMTPITARLSLDDVVPRGTRVEFDLGDYTAPAPAATGPIRQD